MEFFTETKILIIEFMSETFERMSHCILTHASRRNVNVRVLHSTYLEDAKVKILAYNYAPMVVSISMDFPLERGGRLRHDAGLLLMGFVRTVKRQPKVVLYSGLGIAGAKQHLVDTGIVNRRSLDFPPIVERSLLGPHDNWARLVLDNAFTR